MPGRRKDGFSLAVFERLCSGAADEDEFVSGAYVYAISDGVALKIGKSETHPRTRLAQLQTANPAVLKLLAYTHATTERQAHRKLAAWRLRGEWFKLCPEVLAEVNEWDWCDERALAELGGAP